MGDFEALYEQAKEEIQELKDEMNELKECNSELQNRFDDLICELQSLLRNA